MAGACTAGVDTGFVALGYGKVAVLGVVQGITELLPISSTAHMRIVPAFLGWQDPGSAFSAAMQLAALGAVISYFWRDVVGVSAGATLAVMKRDFKDPNFRFALGVTLATIPVVVFGLALSGLLNQCNSPLRSLEVIGTASIVMALLLAAAEIGARHVRVVEQSTLRDHLLIGLAQAGALIPGVSRSGSTLTAAMFLGFKREEAARFSFLLGLPAITLAGVKELWVLARAGLSLEGWAVLGFGLVIASIAAYAAIYLLMAIVERFSAWPFVIYRAGMGTLLLAGVYWGWLS
jgi:undecaprenyl-diphosphatase